jgi:stage II sporulation protein D
MTPLQSLQRLAAALFLASCVTLPTSTLSAVDTLPNVRVRIWADRPLARLRIASAGGLRMGLSALRGPVSLSAEKNTVVARTHGGARRLRVALIGALASDELVLSAGADERRLAGTLRISARNGRLRVVNTMPSETYVLGVIEPELGSLDVPPESLKAQIIASRSYLMAMRGRHRAEGYDFCDGPHCQAFGGLAGIKPVLVAVSRQVSDQYLEYGGKVIPAFYHDSCGGSTAAPEQVWNIAPLPYLRAVRDGAAEPYCRYAPRAHWRLRLDRAALRACLRGVLGEGEAAQSLRVASRDASGRAQSILIQGHTPIRISAQRFRRLVNRHYGSEVMPSTLFSLTYSGKQWLIEGRGWGHGVGLCQWGAMEMAREGKRYKEILAHYYPGTSIGALPGAVYARAQSATSRS